MKTRTLLSLTGIASVLALLLAACGGDETPTPTATTAAPVPTATTAPAPGGTPAGGATQQPTPTQIPPTAAPTATRVPNAREQAEAHFKGKTITLYVGYGAGGGQDTNARVTQAFLGKHIPGNPRIQVENHPGADNLLAGQTAFRAPADGLHIVLVNNVRTQAQSISGDPEPGFNLFEAIYLGNVQIGSPGASAMLCPRTNVATTWDELLQAAKDAGRPLHAGVFRAGSWGEILPKYFDVPVKPVPGFQGTASILQGIDQEELEVLVDACTSEQLQRAREDWITEGDVITPVVNYGGDDLSPAQAMFDTAGWEIPPLLEDVMELNDFQTRLLKVARSMGNITTHPWVIRGETPPFIAETLRTALEATANDPEFQAAMKEANRLGGYTSGEAYEAYRDSVAEAAAGDLRQAVRDFAGLVD